jgi:esterase/lipase superfamily enzyme
MHIDEHRWHSPQLDREMAVKVYGHWGQPFIVFPCSRGRYFDYEGLGMIDAIAPFIESGRIKLFCVDSVDAYSWYDFGVSPAERNARHEQYDRYITKEMVPFVRNHCKDEHLRIMTSGCSMGAFHGVNFFLRHPNLFAGTIALSGLYRLDCPEFGNSREDLAAIYYNSPVHYLADLSDPWYLGLYRESTIVICVGQGAWESEAIEDTRALDHIFQDKGVGAWINYWGHDVNHDWYWWYRQMNYFLGCLYA